MVWFRVDDSLHDHPKVDALEPGRLHDAAIALWTLAGSWCARHLTDGHIPAARIARLGVTTHTKAAAELVRVGLWVTTADGFAFHQWAERQPLRDDVTLQREAAAERQRKHRNASVTESVTRDNGSDSGVSHTTPARAFPVPPRPDPSPKREDPERSLSAIELDAAPRTAAPSREPASIVRRLFAEAYLTTRKTIWAHAAHDREINQLATWADQQARADGVDVEHVVGRVIASACADAYLVGADLPLRTIVKQAGALYRPPPKAAPAGPAPAPNTLLLAELRQQRGEVISSGSPKTAQKVKAIDDRIAAEYAHPTGIADEPERPRFARR